ncbi:MAG TPA: arsenosugar biosynthesis radical SAM (seleno)protein ArsS [Phycisphaerae bacterium]|jgi:radical SAM/Cys-rich protein
MTSNAMVSLTISGSHAFDQRVIQATRAPLQALSIETIQVNIGLACNLACRHCHVEASPKRTEQMDWETMELVLAAARRCEARTIDITGGEPAMHPHFRRFVALARSEEFEVIVRTDLTILLDEGYRDLPEFFRAQHAHLIASLPCYLPENVNRQRGARVYEESIEAIRVLNGVGYGIEVQLPLDLVYNPLGPVLPPAQARLEADYRRELDQRFGLRFTRLLTITNMAIGRFLHDLRRQGAAERYQKLLRDAFNPATLAGLMCRHQLHVGWDGTLYDCDFNFALALPVEGTSTHIRDFEPGDLAARRIVTGEHCFGCTAGCGSSCGGALT